MPVRVGPSITLPNGKAEDAWFLLGRPHTDGEQLVCAVPHQLRGPYS
jgi:hypothetical protein